MLCFRRVFKIGIWAAVPAAAVFAASPVLAATGWTVVTAPPTGQNGYLLAVSADSATDAWAVGTVNRAGEAVGPLIDHWNGTAWSQATGPTIASNTRTSLSAVSAASPSDAWTVGFERVGSGQPQPLAAHWNGTAWSTVAAVNLGVSNYLTGVADLGPGNAYAVGNSSPLASGLLEHWNGTSWSLVTQPNPGAGQQYLPERDLGRLGQ